jgi:hypothetical protein
MICLPSRRISQRSDARSRRRLGKRLRPRVRSLPLTSQRHVLSTLAIGCGRCVMRTDRDIALRAGGCNNRERRGKGCDRGIDGVERGGVVLLWAQLPTSPKLSAFTAYNSPTSTDIVALSEPEPDEAAVAWRVDEAKILADRSPGREPTNAGRRQLRPVLATEIISRL